MFAHVNGIKLYFDVDGSGLVADGPQMVERPVVILVHGGPGGDHTVYKPDYAPLTEVAQVVYYDHRGNGRSDFSDPDHWTLDQWADDLFALCQYLGVDQPIIVGASFGGFVAQAYAQRYPDNLAKLALISTAAKMDFETVFAAFERLGGKHVGAVARAYWETPTDESRLAYREICVPFYSVKPAENDDWLKRIIWKNETALHFNGPNNEQGRMDFTKTLSGLKCPLLIMSGMEDPIMPIEFSREMQRCAPDHLVEFHAVEECRHLTMVDQPERCIGILKKFVASI